ncbi:MAG TPA: ATP cone domain-containing protein [Candidatus Saccharimonadia bacterium]|nr:ATP cone domain-containing protein [Candidatus Saccharimonadia bacterium]
MKCPFCRSNQTEVYNTRTTKFGTQLWRRRRCQTCHEAFTTYEAADLGFLQIRARNASHSPYSRAKLYSGIAAAFETQPAPPTTVDALTDTVESKLLDLKSPVITTEQISATILTTLRHYDTPAFLRYLASHAELRSNAELKRQLKNY